MARLAELVADRVPTDWVFPDTDGNHLHYSNWRRDWWLPALVQEGLADEDGTTGDRNAQLTFHDLKRVATKLLERTSASDKVKERLLGNERAVRL
jgi:hypothetical protein